jgi:nicotinate-nucleotide adenylyltransferase
MLRLGVMGGTFDPPHLGHLVMAEQAREALGLDKVVFIPAGQPPHKADRVVADAEHRYRMTILSTASNTAFEVSRAEIESEWPSYSVDTLRRLRDTYGAEADIRFIIGADEAMDIQSWHKADELPGLARFLVAPRPGCDLKQLSKLDKKFLDVMDVISMPTISISSTELRGMVAAGKSIRYLVPDTVESYIYENRLYGSVKAEF